MFFICMCVHYVVVSVVVRLFRCFVFVSFLYVGTCVNLFVVFVAVMVFVFVCLLCVVFVCAVVVRFLKV